MIVHTICIHSPISKEVADYFGKNNYFTGKVENKIFECEYFELKCNEKDGNYEAMIRPSSYCFK